MKQHISMIYSRKGESRYQNTALFLVSAAFLLGGFLGWMAEERLSSAQYVQMFLEATKEGSQPSALWREVWNLSKWPILVILMGYLPMTGASIFAALCLRGFLLSYSISAFMEAGIRNTVFLFGPTCVLTLPVLFLLAAEMLLKKAGEPSRLKLPVILACLLALCLCAVLNQMVVPLLLT